MTKKILGQGQLHVVGGVSKILMLIGQHGPYGRCQRWSVTQNQRIYFA